MLFVKYLKFEFFKIMYYKKYIVLTTTQKSHPHYLGAQCLYTSLV